MRTSLIAVLFFSCLFSFSQKQKFNINWGESQSLNSGYGTINVPTVENFESSYNDQQGFFIYKELDQSVASNANFSNLEYETISVSQLFDIDLNLIPSQVKAEYSVTSSRGKRKGFIYISPIVKVEGTYQRLVSFEMTFSSSFTANVNSSVANNTISNSVLASGDWYRFYVEDSGVFRLDRDFLNDLGINTNSLDPRTIRIFGNGGQMIPQRNSVSYPIDPTELAIWVEGEDDGSFDNGDFVLFYAQGPHGLHQHS